MEAKENEFSIAEEIDGESLMDERFAIAKVITDEGKPAPDKNEVRARIAKFLN